MKSLVFQLCKSVGKREKEGVVDNLERNVQTRSWELLDGLGLPSQIVITEHLIFEDIKVHFALNRVPYP